MFEILHEGGGLLAKKYAVFSVCVRHPRKWSDLDVSEHTFATKKKRDQKKMIFDGEILFLLLGLPQKRDFP